MQIAAHRLHRQVVLPHPVTPRHLRRPQVNPRPVLPPVTHHPAHLPANPHQVNHLPQVNKQREGP